MGASGVNMAERGGPIPVYDQNLVEPKAEEGGQPELSIQFLFVEGESNEIIMDTLVVLRAGDAFPGEIFVKKMEGRNNSSDARYYLGFEDKKETREFNRVIIKCENITITDTITIKSKIKSLYDDGANDIENTDIDENPENPLPILNALSVFTSEDNGTITASYDITKHILDIQQILGAQNSSNCARNCVHSRVPSVKKCTIKTSVSRNGITPVSLDFENQRYIVWKKLISRFEVQDFNLGNIGDRTIERRLARHFGNMDDYVHFNISNDETQPEIDLILKGPHLFYYRFKYPNSHGDKMIFIRKEQHYKDIKANDDAYMQDEIYLMRSNIGKMNLMHRHSWDTQSRLKSAIELAEKTFVNIMYCFNSKNENFSSSPYKLSELIGIKGYNTCDGTWVERFQGSTRHSISMHCYGVAVDINNQNYYNQERRGTWDLANNVNSDEINYASIIHVLNLLIYEKCEDEKVNSNLIKRNYFFSCKCNAWEYENRNLVGENGKRDYFNIRYGWALVNWFLYHLVFKHIGFYWGGYYENNRNRSSKTDAMHFSLIEYEPEKDKSFLAYPLPLNDTAQRKFVDTRRNLTVYSPKEELVFQGISIEGCITNTNALLVLTFDKPPTMLTVDNIRVTNATKVSIVPRGSQQQWRKIYITGDFSVSKDVTVSIVNPPPEYVFLMPNEQYDRSFSNPPTPPKHTIRILSDSKEVITQ